MGPSECNACLTEPVMRCGRCTLTRCAAHAMRPGERCEMCERDWEDEASTRRAAKLIFAPPVALFVGGVLFSLLVPVSIGATMIAAIVACGTAVGAGAGACRVVDRSARAMFLRERAGTLPTARLLPSGRHH